MIHWENSRSTEQRHVHTVVTDARGQNICTQCQQIVIEPITSSDDPRLDEAGFHRSGDQEEATPLQFPMGLPELLIRLYHMYDDFPIAPYLDEIIALHAPHEAWFFK